MLSENLNYILKTCGQLRDPLCLFIFLSEIRFSPLGVRESLTLPVNNITQVGHFHSTFSTQLHKFYGPCIKTSAAKDDDGKLSTRRVSLFTGY